MTDDHDTLTELRRQLDVVRRRIDETVAALRDARDAVSADGLEDVPAAAMTEGRGDLFQLCVRLEVALAESRESLEKLTLRLRQLAAHDPLGWPWVPDPPTGNQSLGHDWRH